MLYCRQANRDELSPVAPAQIRLPFRFILKKEESEVVIALSVSLSER